MNVRGMGAWLKRTYDRIIASVVLLVLLVSLVMLAANAQMLKVQQAEFDRELNGLKPRFPEAMKADVTPFQTALARLDGPAQLQAWTNRLLVPELRVNCVNCDRPIPYAATNCYYCKTPQPEEVKAKDKDRDNDGIPDEWETQHGLNPLDPEDAKADPDGDGFSNLEEYKFNTDPHSAASHPPPLAKVVVESIKPLPFSLVFKSVNRVDGNKTLYQVNLRKGGKTYWAALGDTIEGFTVASFDEKAPDGPTLVFERAGKKIPLVKGKVVPRSEYEVTLYSSLDKARISTRVEAEFELRGVKYQVKKVDTEATRVLIHDPSRDMDVWINAGTSRTSTESKAEEGA